MPVTRHMVRPTWIRVAAPSGDFTPDDLSGLIAWFDASDTATLTGSPGVSQWADKSSSGLTPVQATGSKQPTTGTRTINGLNVLDFDAGDLLTDASIFTQAQPFTIYGVGRIDSFGAGTHPRFLGINSGNLVPIYYRNASARWATYAGSAESISTFTPITGMDMVFCAIVNGASSKLYQNGVDGALSTNPGTGSIQTNLAIGANSTETAGAFWDGPIAEIIVYSGAHSDTDRGTVQTYLNEKWGLVPMSITGLVAWFDASDTSTITQSSGAVSQWDDKSGGARHVTQATGGLKPTTGTRTLNSLNVLDFTGDVLTHDLTDVAQPLTMAVVCMSDNPDSGNHQVLGNFSAPQPLIFADSDAYRYYAGTAQSSGVTEDAVPHVIVGVFNGASSELRIDGVQTTTANPGTASLQQIAIGSDTTAFFPWDGTVAEVCYYDSALSGTDLTNLETYLLDKWGL